ncbi:transposase-like protein [Nonomuraea rubra]|uniref:Transposase-like protein n=1 Tax=Nonomuraea rubra TaxID=46180 RepID=A0A7X0NLU4_9ACTN|nr:transposase-like protein [Nonomuraea rubra]
MVLEGDRRVASVAREFDINASTLGNWVNRYRIAHAQDEQPVSGPVRAGPGRSGSGSGSWSGRTPSCARS